MINDPEDHSTIKVEVFDKELSSPTEIKDFNHQKHDTRIEVSQVLADSHDNILTKKKLLVVFSAMALVLFISFVDQTGITVVLPYMADELNAADTISWAGTASLIAQTCFSAFFGRFSDIFSRKYVLIGCLLLLAVFDLGCGFCQTPEQLYVFRAICGISNGGITALTMVIVSDIVTLQERGKYQGILGSCVGLGNALGPFIASAFLSKYSWREFFYFLCPAVVAATLVIWWYVPYTKPDISFKEKLMKIDYTGFFFSSTATVFVLIPISGGGSYYEWDSPMVISFFIIGGIAFAIFLVVEAKYALLPMMPLHLFTTSVSLTTLLIQNLLYGMSYFGATYYYPYYFQVVKGYSVIKTSVHLLALVLTQSVTSTICGQIISRTGVYIYVIWYGAFFWTLGVCLLALWNPSSNALVIIALVINGTGVGAIFQPTLVAVQAQTYKRDRAIVISARNVLRSIGGAIGLAVASLIVSNTYIKEITTNGKDLFSETQLQFLRSQVFSTLHLGDNYSPTQLLFLQNAYMGAMKNLFYFWMGAISSCLVSNLVVKGGSLKPLDEK